MVLRDGVLRFGVLRFGVLRFAQDDVTMAALRSLFKLDIHHHDFRFACCLDRRSPQSQSARHKKMGVPDLFMAPAQFVEAAHIKIDGEKLSVVCMSRELHAHRCLADLLKLGGTVVEHDDRQ